MSPPRPHSAPPTASGIETDPRAAYALLEWYRDHQRDLPWRRSADPYAVWISEIMLQQTRVATVIPYFERWLERFPDVAALAAADEDEVLHCWQGLGYYSRARSLRRAAQEIRDRHAGVLPSDVVVLRKLPGIGPYTAGAIASIAFGRDEPAVDGNVVRVISRLFAVEGDPQRKPVQRRIEEITRALLPPGRAADFNQALMELGATVCLPRSPRCAECPVRGHCLALRLDQAERFPETRVRPAPTRLRHVAVWIERGGKVLVEKLGPDAPWWRGMWTLPTVEAEPEEDGPTAALRAGRQALGENGRDEVLRDELVHHVTRYRIQLQLWQFEPPAGARVPDGALRWVPLDELDALALPAPYRKLIERRRGGYWAPPTSGPVS